MEQPDISENDVRMHTVGMMCAHWAYVEFLLSATIWVLLELDEDTGKIVTGGLDIVPRARMALTLAKHLKAHPEIRHALQSARDGIEEVSGDRNLVVHGVYSLYPDTNTVTAEVHRGKFQRTAQEMGLPRIKKVLENIVAIENALESVLSRHGLITV